MISVYSAWFHQTFFQYFLEGGVGLVVAAVVVAVAETQMWLLLLFVLVSFDLSLWKTYL
jgi:hypothetical protein